MNNQTQQTLQAYGTVKGPSWRWKLANEMVRSTCEWPDLDDSTVAQAKSYAEICAAEEGESHAAQQYPGIAAARMLWQDSNTRKSLMILTLGDVPQDEIAKRLMLPVQLVATTELLFFDIRDRLDANSWIMHQVIFPAERAGDVELATLYRIAYWAGPLVAQEIIDSEGRVSFDGVQRLADQEFRLGVKAQAASEILLDSERSRLRCQKLYLEYQSAKQRLELQKEKFRRRCEGEIRKQESAQGRIDAKSEREGRARDREEGVRNALVKEQQAAKERGLKSPLTRLRWSSEINFQSKGANDSQPLDRSKNDTAQHIPKATEVAA
jgi:hypothetical protein